MLTLAIVAGTCTVLCGLVIGLANMMSDAPTSALSQAPTFAGLALTLGLLAAWHFG